MLNRSNRNQIFSLSVFLVLISCGSSDHSGRYVGTETVSQNGISETNQVTLDISQNQSTLNGSYSSSNVSGTLVATVNASDENRIESVSLTLTSKENYLPSYMQGYNSTNPSVYGYTGQYNQQPNVQLNQNAYSYQQYMNAQNTQNGNVQNPQIGLNGIPNSSGVNCSGTYTGEWLANESRDRLVGNTTLSSSDLCGNIIRSIDLRKTEQ